MSRSSQVLSGKVEAYGEMKSGAILPCEYGIHAIL